jgi:hypothetical protein
MDDEGIPTAVQTWNKPHLVANVVNNTEIANSMYRRARRLHLLARFALVLILVSICGGLALFAFSGRIANDDDQASRDNLGGRKREIERKQKALSLRLKSAPAECADLAIRLPGSTVPVAGDTTQDEPPVPELRASDMEALRTARAKGFQARSAPDEATASAEAIATKNCQSDFSSAANDSRRLFDVEEGKVTAKLEHLNLPSLASALSLRIGSAVLLIFLVQILVGVYRYSLRLASFYEGRADAIRMARGDLKEFRKIVSVLSAEKVPFGPDAKTPIHQIVELAEKLSKAGARPIPPR